MKNLKSWMQKMKKWTIKEIKEQLQLIESKEDPFLKEIQADERKGVQSALKQWFKKYEARQVLKEKYIQMSKFEKEASQAGFHLIAGIDEVGRGPLAGPVVAAAVILDPKQPIIGLDDSKKLSLKKRLQLFEEIRTKSIAVTIGVSDAEEIDQLNILQATKKAMNKAVSKLDIQPDMLFIDAETIDSPIPQKAIIKGDSFSNSIAAASIIAKVSRDKMMEHYDNQYPGYDFKNNAGYGTQAHLEGLKKLGPSPIHRRSFAPVKNFLK